MRRKIIADAGSVVRIKKTPFLGTELGICAWKCTIMKVSGAQKQGGTTTFQCTVLGGESKA
jgi:hypothetical protein